jgi:hypothetical protein
MTLDTGTQTEIMIQLGEQNFGAQGNRCHRGTGIRLKTR